MYHFDAINIKNNDYEKYNLPGSIDIHDVLQ